MKVGKKISIILLSIAMVLVLASCDNVYYSAVSGRVTDASGNGIKDVNVYAYTSKSERDNALSRYKEGTEFNDPECLFRATTAASGDFSIGKIVWKTSKSEWGNDYASATLHFIFFSKDYGIKTYDDVNIISGSANGSSVTVNMGNKNRTNGTLTINFKDKEAALGRNISDPISFTYSYNDGYSDVTADVVSSNGSFTIPMTFVNEAEVTISNIKNSKGYWASEQEEYKYTVTSASEIHDIELSRKKYALTNGIEGIVNYKSSDKYEVYLNGAEVTAYYDPDGKYGTVSNGKPSEFDGAKGKVEVGTITSTDNPNNDNPLSISVTGKFSSLLNGLEIEKGDVAPKFLVVINVPVAKVTTLASEGVTEKFITKSKEITINQDGTLNHVSFQITSDDIATALK